AALQITDEALNLAFGLRPVRLAQARQESGVAGVIEESSMEAMDAAPIGVPLDHDRAHIVVEHLNRDPAKRHQGVLMNPDQRLDALVVTELDIGRSAPTHCRDEHLELVGATPNSRPVRLHLMTGLSLEPDHRRRRGRRHQPTDELLQSRLATVIAARLDLAEQNDGWHPIRRRCLHSIDDVTFSDRASPLASAQLCALLPHRPRASIAAPYCATTQ